VWTATIDREWSAIAASEPGAILLQRVASQAQHGRSLLFRNPIKVIEAKRPGEVREGFVAAEEALAQGFHLAGYVSYEAGFALEPALADLSLPLPDGAPLLWLGCYQLPETCQECEPRRASRSGPLGVTIQFAMAAEVYAQKVERIRALIEAGETYQANLTMNAEWSTDERPAEMYERLLRAQPVGYAALLHPESGWHVLSLSPELFFARDGQRIITRPMKGTASPGLDMAETRAKRAWLQGDEKNRAENLMIVDLLRNDLGRICRVGSIEVTKLFEVERYPTLLQMTSTVEGQLRENVGYLELFSALFPSGSIVGAPKIHTMRLLRKLENRTRGIYTGAIGFMAPNGVAEFNVAIRTTSLRNGKAQFGVGSGIVYDSEPALEYEECRMKTTFLVHKPESEFQLIETLLLEEQAYALLKQHVERMAESAEYFDMVFDGVRVLAALEDAARASTGNGRTRVRLLLDRHGTVTWTISRLDPDEDAVVVLLLGQQRTDPADRFLRHKTTHRTVYDDALREAQMQGYTDVLFRNSRDEITEGAVHNVIASIEGLWHTPPLECGLLPGVYRRYMLDEGRLSERVLTVNDLRRADAVFVCNSVRGLRRVRRIMEQSENGDVLIADWTDREPLAYHQ
jgi:para-aminobenzoate synthetase/4-amino-4-deoxychorismate lyase